MGFRGLVYRAAVEVQTGIPSGVPGSAAFEGAASKVANDSVLGALLVIVVGVCFLLGWVIRSNAKMARKDYRELEAEHEEHRKEWQTREKALYDLRMSDFRELLVALQNSTGVISVNSQRLAEGSSSSQEIAQKIFEVVLITKANSENIKAVKDEHASTAKAINDLAAALSRGPTGGYGPTGGGKP